MTPYWGKNLYCVAFGRGAGGKAFCNLIESYVQLNSVNMLACDALCRGSLSIPTWKSLQEEPSSQGPALHGSAYLDE